MREMVPHGWNYLAIDWERHHEGPVPAHRDEARAPARATTPPVTSAGPRVDAAGVECLAA
jgi:hypothetical protein